MRTVVHFTVALSFSRPQAALALASYREQTVCKRLNNLALDVIGSSAAEFTARIDREIPQWAKVIRRAGISASD